MKVKNIIFSFLFLIIFTGLSFAEPGIKITQPQDNFIVNPGQQMTVTVEAVEGFVINYGTLGVSNFFVERFSSLPITFTVTIPLKSSGIIPVWAIAKDVSGKAAGEKIVLKVQQIATLQSLEINQDDISVYLDWDGNIKRKDTGYIVTVYGIYSDGIKREIPKEELTYTSSDPSVISVDSEGNYQVHKVGQATITISNSGVSKVIPVVFLKPRGIKPSETIPPNTTIDIQPPANTAGWHNQGITITLIAQDNEGGSGIQEVDWRFAGKAKEDYVYGDSAVVTYDVEGVKNFSYWSRDKEGNEDDNRVEIRLDKTPPVITANVSPQPNSSGWNNTDVKATFTASDSLSGVAHVTPPATVTTEGAKQQIDGEAVDFADNKATTYAIVNLDRTPPLLSLNLEPYKIKLPFRLDKFHFFMPFFYKLTYSASDTLSGLKDLKAGLVIPSINGFKTQLIKGKRTQIVLDGTKKRLSIIAPDPQSILNQLKTNMFLIENNQLMHLNQRPKLRIWTITKLDKFLIIKAPPVTFKAEAGDYADNSSTKQIQYLKKRIPLPEHIKPLINRRELSSEEIKELMEDAEIDRDTLKIIRKNYKIKY